MTLAEIDFYRIFEVFMLLLIGIGPKIALVPFIDITAGLDTDTKKAMANKSVRTAIGWSLGLVALGWFLMKLLHFTTGSVLIAGGIVLLLMSLHMLLSGAKAEDPEDLEAHEGDPMDLAYYPLAVPYILNPVGIAVLVIASSGISTILDAVILIVLVLSVGLIDLVLFRNIDSVAKFMDPAKLAVTEAVFGVLLAALAIQMMVVGMVELEIITAAVGH
ncbi:MAG: MarC family protein [Chloroflexota bacterium]|nr:MarC family protein [Chloroflexota bacterium]